VIFLPDEKTLIEKIYSAFFIQVFPLDLKIVVIWLLASILTIYLPYLNATPLRYVFTIPVVLFIPGYCLFAALFPQNGDLTLLERIALSFGFSIVIVPLIGLGLNFTPWGIRLEPLIISLTFFTWVTVLIAHYRRTLIPFEEQFRLPFFDIVGSIRKGIFSASDSRTVQILNITLVFTIVIALIVTMYIIVVPKEGERFTEFYILGEKQEAADYPDWIIVGENYPMYVGIGNHEYHNITYTIETWMISSEIDSANNTSHIIDMDPSDRLSITLTHNETSIIPYNLSVKRTGYNRVEFLLFKENVPSFHVTGSDRINASYRNLHLWIIDH
jgi:uncharacterized membrane protein